MDDSSLWIGSIEALGESSPNILEESKHSAEIARFCLDLHFPILHICYVSEIQMLMAFGVQANLPYVLWTVGYNTTFLLGYLVLEIGLFGQNPDSDSIIDAVPPLLEAINSNGLAIFLVVRILHHQYHLDPPGRSSLRPPVSRQSSSLSPLQGFSSHSRRGRWLLAA